MKRCIYCGRENDDSVVACIECGSEVRTATPAPPPSPPPPRKVEPPPTRGENLFVWLCILAPAAFTAGRYLIQKNLLAAGVFTAIGVVLSVVLFGWTAWNLYRRRRHRVLGLASCLVCVIHFKQVSDDFASHTARERRRLRGTNAAEAVLQTGSNGTGISK